MANISAIKLPNGTTYNLVDKTSGYITNAGVTGVKGNAETAYRTGNVNLTAANIGAAPTSHTHSANDLNGGYINIHPENSPIIIPFIHNDIAHLLKRGGSASITYDGMTQTVDLSNCFDGSGSYWSVSGNISTIVIELTLHKQFAWTNTIYVDFGATAWRAKSIKIEAMNTNYSGDTWATKINVTNYSTGHITCAGAHTPSGASNAGGGFNKLRFTFSDFSSISTSGGSFRISQIGIYNYGSVGLRETYMSRGADDPIFRSITPYANNTYNLGSSSNKWANIYATTFTGNLTGNVTGNVSGTAGGVAWANVSGKPTLTGSKTTSITASTTATKTTLGTAFTIPNITGVGTASTWAFEEISIPNVTSVGSASTWSFTNVTVPIRADSDTTVPTAASSATACDDITAWSAGSGSYTQGSFSGGSGSFSATVTNHVLSFSHTHTAATHGNDSHTHTAPSLSYTARSITGVSGSTTVRGVKTGTSSTTTASKASGANGSAPTLGTAIKVQSKKSGANSTVPTLGTAFTVPNVTGNTSATVSITDNGHTHSI